MGEKLSGVPIVVKASSFNLLERIIYPLVSREVGRRIEGLFDTQGNEGALDEFSRRYRMGAFGLVAEGPHLCHADPLAVMKDMRRLKRKSGANGFLMPTSITLINGGQVEANKWYKPLVIYMNSNSFEPLPVVTANDYKRLLENSPNPEEIKRNLDSINISATRRMLSARQNNEIVFALPEGTVKAGRRDENGDLFGMQKVKDTVLAKILGKNVDGRGGNAEDFVVLPVGIWGSEKLLNPTTYKVNPEILDELKRLPFLRKRKTFASVRMGEPFGKSEYRDYLASKGKLDIAASDGLLAKFMSEFPDTFFDFLMGENIARMIPKQYRGAYSKFTI